MRLILIVFFIVIPDAASAAIGITTCKGTLSSFDIIGTLNRSDVKQRSSFDLDNLQVWFDIFFHCFNLFGSICCLFHSDTLSTYDIDALAQSVQVVGILAYQLSVQVVDVAYGRCPLTVKTFDGCSLFTINKEYKRTRSATTACNLDIGTIGVNVCTSITYSIDYVIAQNIVISSISDCCAAVCSYE